MCVCVCVAIRGCNLHFIVQLCDVKWQINDLVFLINLLMFWLFAWLRFLKLWVEHSVPPHKSPKGCLFVLVNVINFHHKYQLQGQQTVTFSSVISCDCLQTHSQTMQLDKLQLQSKNLDAAPHVILYPKQLQKTSVNFPLFSEERLSHSRLRMCVMNIAGQPTYSLTQVTFLFYAIQPAFTNIWVISTRKCSNSTSPLLYSTISVCK